MARQKSPLFFSSRLAFYVMMFVTVLLHYAIRYALNMSIVCMVIPPQQQQQLNNTAADVNTNIKANDSLDKQCMSNAGVKKDFGYEGEFHWSRLQVGHILGSFFYAYIPMQVLAGWMADKFGTRHVMGTGMLVGGILSLLTPVAARVHYGLLIALRVVMGFSMGVTFPCIHSSIGKWVPDDERCTFVGWVFGGGSAGLIVSFLLSGFLCGYSWTYVFYVLGGVTILWYLIFLYIVYSDPDDHPRISGSEKSYIRLSNEQVKGSSRQTIRIPWKQFLTSRCVWGMCVSHFALLWLLYTVNAGIPLYMQDVMYFKIKSNGVLSSLPSLIQVVFGGVIGTLCDVVHRHLIKSRTVMRQLSQAIFTIGCGVFTVLVGFMDCEQRTSAVVFFCLIYFFIAFTRGGSVCSPSDVAPRIAGTVYGLTNLVGNMTGFLVPITIGNLTPTGSQAEWQRIFYLSTGILLVGWLSFLFLVKAEERPWARGPVTVVTTDIPADENYINMKHLTQELDLKHNAHSERA